MQKWQKLKWIFFPPERFFLATKLGSGASCADLCEPWHSAQGKPSDEVWNCLCTKKRPLKFKSRWLKFTVVAKARFHCSSLYAQNFIWRGRNRSSNKRPQKGSHRWDNRLLKWKQIRENITHPTDKDWSPGKMTKTKRKAKTKRLELARGPSLLAQNGRDNDKIYYVLNEAWLSNHRLYNALHTATRPISDFSSFPNVLGPLWFWSRDIHDQK